MIFYLQARGLDRLQARALLLEGWARDFMSHVPSKNAKDRAADKAAQLSADVSRQAARCSRCNRSDTPRCCFERARESTDATSRSRVLFRCVNATLTRPQLLHNASTPTESDEPSPSRC